MSEPNLPWVRLVVAAAVIVHMQLGPVVHQVLRLPRPPTTMSWQMYSGVGLNVCAFEWFTVEADGAAVPLDRLAALGTDRHDAPYLTRFVFGRDNLRQAAADVCAAVPDRVVRVKARCGLLGPWEPIWDLDDAPCADPPPPRRVRRKKP